MYESAIKELAGVTPNDEKSARKVKSVDAFIDLVLEGNLWTDPCGCVTVTGQRDGMLAGTIMDKRVLCPEGYRYRWAED